MAAVLAIGPINREMEGRGRPNLEKGASESSERASEQRDGRDNCESGRKEES